MLQQSYTCLELLVIDDGSASKLDSLLPADSRIRYFRQSCKGVAAARNLGLQKALAEWIAFLDSDDIWHKDKLKQQLDYLREYPETSILQCREIWIRNNKRVNPARKHKKKSGDFFIESLQLCLISPSAVIIKKNIFTECGVFDEKLPACEDYDLWLRILSRYPAALLEKNLVTRYAGHADQLSRAFACMDRFRVYTLRKILGYNLSPARKKAVLQTLCHKCRIIYRGAFKRGRWQRWLRYFFYYCYYRYYRFIQLSM